MALPTLQSYYMTRRGRAQPERLIVQRRTHESDVKQKWTEHSRYFHSSEVQSLKQEAWTSTKSFQDSMNAYHSKVKVEEKRRRLVERREKLRRLLEGEKEAMEKELKEKSRDKFSYMKERTEALKSHREHERKKVAEEKLQEHWRSNCPDLRRLESQQMQKAVEEGWEEQIRHRQQDLESARRENERYELAVEEERLAALRLEEEEERRRKMEEREYARSLQRQVAEIKAREEEAAMLEQQQAVLLQEQVELEKAEEERRQLEVAQRRAEHGRVLARQYKAQLRRKSQQIQEALELDLRILEDLSKKEEEDKVLRTARRERAKADAEWMKKVIADQLKLEREREAELDLLYQEEAARMWRMREAEWEREARARQKLMAQVMDERQQQIQSRMDLLKAKQAESIQQREALLQEMEMISQMANQESRQKQEDLTRRAEELEIQVTERKRRAERARLQYERELEEQKHAEEEYEALVKAEESRMTARGYRPKPFMKKKHAWY